MIFVVAFLGKATPQLDV